MSKILFEKIVCWENLKNAFGKTQLGSSKYKADAILFAKNETFNLKQLQKSIIDNTYKFDDYEEFIVYEPKERIINAPRYKDKVVQIAINNILKDVYNKCFIYDSYACIDNKGTHKCVDRIQHFMRKAKWKYGADCYVVKVDIKKFFYTIDRGILKRIITKKIRCKKTLSLVFKIIDSADSVDVLGLPLGNTLSQLCANIYLNELDQYAKRGLGLKYYVRFADDILIVVENKQRARDVLSLIKGFLKTNLKLETNYKKTKIFPLKQGTNSIGFKISCTHKLLRNESKKRIKRKIKKMPILISNGKMKTEKAEQMLNSWRGHAKNGCSKNFITKLTSEYDFLYTNKSGALRINKKGSKNKEVSKC